MPLSFPLCSGTTEVISGTVSESALVEIPAGKKLVLDPHQDTTLEINCTGPHAGLIVRGTLESKPACPEITHTIRLTNVNEAGFVGGGMVPLSTDPGIWVVDGGKFNVAGSPKTAWLRTTAGLASGATTLTLTSAPVGWRVGDEVLIAPTGLRGQGGWQTEEVRSIQAINGATITLVSALANPHPSVTIGPNTYTPEVANLTRNLRLEGTTSGRTHIFFHPTSSQIASDFVVRHVGVRGVKGRYGLHFHEAEDATRGTVLESVVIRDSEHRGFVPHKSHGITLRNCVGYNIVNEFMWYDPDDGLPAGQTNGPNDLVVDRCLAGLIKPAPGNPGVDLSAYWLGAGTGNICRDSVAFRVVSSKEGPGFKWPGESFGIGVWVFERCMAHNNERNGILVWQNTPMNHVVSDFVAYNNGRSGIEHGSYRNGYRYERTWLFRNGNTADDKTANLIVHAASRGDVVQTYDALYCDGDNYSPYGVKIEKHSLDTHAETVFESPELHRHTKAAFGLAPNLASSLTHKYELRNPTFSGNEMWISKTTITADSYTDLMPHPTLGNIRVKRDDQVGIPKAEWQAVYEILP